jgi:hypothetical protein
VGRAFGLCLTFAIVVAGGLSASLAVRGELHSAGWFFVAAFAVVGGLAGLVAGSMLSYAAKHPRSRIAKITRSDFFQGDD